MKLGKLFIVLVVCSTFSALVLAQAPAVAEGAGAQARVGDILWVWGNPEMGVAGTHSAFTFAEASPSERAQLLGTPNIIMAGMGLPDDDNESAKLTQEVSHAPRLVWEIAPDTHEGAVPFSYDQTVARVRQLAASHPQIEGVLLDDMTSVAIDKGFEPGHIRRIRELLGDTNDQVKVWGVVYTMNLGRDNIDAYLAELDVINLWTWHAKDIPQIRKHVEDLRAQFPEKPIVLGLYLYDYGDGRAMPLDVLAEQCETALELVRAGMVQDIVFLTITNDAATVGWAADWIEHVKDEPLVAPAPTPLPDALPLRMDDGSNWSFLGGDWSQNAEGVIRPADVRNLHSRAFNLDQTYGDVTAEFEFNGDYRETGTGSAGLILRAKDPNHFYLVYFPWGGQQLRAKHFWAVIAKVDGDGYIRHLAAEWVPGLASETDRWYQVKVEAIGPRIRVWVDGQHAVDVTDDSYGAGHVGLAGYGWYAFRNVHIHGVETDPPDWEDAGPVPRHAFTVGLSSEQMPSGCIAPNGDVILAAGNQLVRSKDRGRTWEVPETLPDSLGTVTDYGNGMFRSGDRLYVMIYNTQETVEKTAPEILMAESSDNGVTWSDPVPATVAPEWPAFPKNLVPYGPVTENADGVWMRFLLGGVKLDNDPYPDVRTWGSIHAKAFVMRSSDQGTSWSAPIELDRPSWVGVERGTIPGSLDFTEPTGVVMGDTVTVLIRPVYSPYMWQCWSYDGGATWDAARRTTFPGYAQSMVRTSSGAILCAHRYPHYAVNASRDDGLHWDAGTVIDYAVWAMGCLVEVEPDVVLSTYMNAERSQPLLAQLIAVTPTGIRPMSIAAGE
jgi:hypothetical protein